MTKDEFCALPVQLALGLVYDMARAKLEPMRCPDVPRAPRFDGRISRKEGQFTWMSEMLLSDLQWWRDAKAKTADEGGRYAEQATKTVKTLDQWILWRNLFPNEQWRGTRGDDRVTAAPPSREPKLHKWESDGASKKTGGAKPPAGPRGATPPPAEDPDEYGF